jgi:hypothetical protein
MAETGVLFIAQNMMIGEHRQAIILLRIQAADPRNVEQIELDLLGIFAGLLLAMKNKTA